ncbi:lamin tail domain-containing protein [Candidatus Peregrinibacteria bacterium]|nr:lamin tail domain-containing protein [Candidatus Peregrinibacteria bacterium]
MKKLQLFLACVAMAAMIGHIAPFGRVLAGSADPTVVINEVAWAGTVASSSDEWIELWNGTDRDIDLSGWTIEDDGGSQMYAIGSGTITPKSYFLIEKVEESTSVPADALAANMSLSNTGDSLVMKDSSGREIDTVNGSGGAWHAGSAATKTSMERRRFSGADHAEDWADAVSGSGATDRGGNAVTGTPRGKNSVAENVDASPSPSEGAAKIRLLADTLTPEQGAQIQLQVKVEDAAEAASYGFDILYDPAVLAFLDASSGQFLSSQGGAASFQTGLEDKTSGKLVVGEALTSGTPVSGSGFLFKANFRVIGDPGSRTIIRIGSASFLADKNRDLPVEFSDISLAVALTVTHPVRSLEARENANRYELKLVWAAPEGGATGYKIFRKNPRGEFLLIGETAELFFLDRDGVAGGGSIIPGKNYEYRVTAVKNEIESATLSISQKETRGITGDNDRSGRVDGRDLERLAKHFGTTLDSGAFNPLVDTTYDGVVDGGDLVDIGMNWALTYSP